MKLPWAEARLSPHRLCLLAVLALLALQWLWPFRVWPAMETSGLVLAVLASAPLFAILAALLLKRRTARFWAGVAALFYFSHGIAEAWAVSEHRLPGLLEALLSVVMVLASSWEGLRARLGARGRRNV